MRANKAIIPVLTGAVLAGVILVTGCASLPGAGAKGPQPVVLLDFESAALGVLTEEYILSGSDAVPEGTKVVVKKFGRDAEGKATDGPEIVAMEAVEATAVKGLPLGRQALSVQSGRRVEGLVIDLVEAVDGVQPFPVSSMTVEFVFMTKGLNPAGNAFGFQYLGGNEWPNGGQFSWSFRTAKDQVLNFVSFQGSKEIRLFVKEQIVPGQWYHAAGVLDYNSANPVDSMLRFYLNGVLQNESPCDASAYAFVLGGSNSVYGNGFSVGYSYGQDANGGDHRGLDGAIDAVSITLAALAPGGFMLGGNLK
jgi:hypothetical protein